MLNYACCLLKLWKYRTTSLNNFYFYFQGHDAGTSDDSGRASEVRPSGLPHGHRESSHDHLSDASSRCSSGRGYIVRFFFSKITHP